MSVPLAINDEVAVTDPMVALPPVSEEIPEVIALKILAKKLDEVALASVAPPVTERPSKVGVPLKV